MPPSLVVFFTDFGTDGPYVGQMRLAVGRNAPEVPVVNLMHDAPRFDPKASAYLLASLAARLPPRAVCVGVVDPGVGGARPGVIVEADGKVFVGPGNGLFEIVRRRATDSKVWILPDNPEASPSFHGRDIFAPAGARLAAGVTPEDLGARAASLEDLPGRDWPDDLAEIIYVDHYGNAMTGVRSATVPHSAELHVKSVTCQFARTFSEVGRGAAFWYENSNGLAEIAVNGGSARDDLGLHPGHSVEVRSS